MSLRGKNLTHFIKQMHLPPKQSKKEKDKK